MNEPLGVTEDDIKRATDALAHRLKNPTPVTAEVALKDEVQRLTTENRMLAFRAKEFDRLNDEVNKIGDFIRQSYNWEIHNGKHDHFAGVASVVIHYMRIERKRLGGLVVLLKRVFG